MKAPPSGLKSLKLTLKTRQAEVLIGNCPILGGGGVLVAVVVWRADLYQKETLKLLSNSCFHGKVDKDLIALLQIYSPTDAAPQFL